VKETCDQNQVGFKLKYYGFAMTKSYVILLKIIEVLFQLK